MKKYNIISFLLVLMLLTTCFPTNAKADSLKAMSAKGEVVNIQTSLLVRKSPSTSAKILGSLKYGAEVVITGETNNWYRIQYQSGTAYVSKSYVSAKSKNNQTVVDFHSTAYVKVDGTLNVRTAASKNSSVIGSLTTGKKVTINGETADWFRISYGSDNAFVSKDYITFEKESDSQDFSSGNQTGTVQVNTTLLVRKTASSSSKVLGYLTDGKQVSILGSSNGYYQIRYQSTTAYASQKYIVLGDSNNSDSNPSTSGSSSSSSSNSSSNSGTSNNSSNSKPNTSGSSSSSSSNSVTVVSKTGYADVTTSLLVRKTASSRAAVIGRLKRGAAISITGEIDNWYQIRYAGKTGYVNKAYVAFGAISVDGYETIQLDVPLYKQYDSRWASIRIGRETLRSAGCVTSCLAMLQEYRTNTTCTPAMMVQKLSYTSSGNVYWPSATTQYTGSNYLTVIYQQLAAGNPVIIGAKFSGSNAQHYVTVTGYNGSKTALSASGFTVNDPGRSGATNLKSFLARTPRFYKLIYYR